MTKKLSPSLLPILLFVAGLAFFAVASFLVFSPEKGPAPSAIGGPFTLTSQDGTKISDKDLQGRPFLVFFGFTHCPDVCPTALFEVTQVFSKLGPNAKISALFITVDPERDTPAVMKDYVSNFDPRIKGVSGDRADLEKVYAAYRVYAKKIPAEKGDDYSMDHTAIIYLMDKQGRFVNAFNMKQSPEDAAKELAKYL